MTRREAFYLFALVATSWTLSGCGAVPAASADAASVRPTVLRFCYSPSSEEPQVQSLRLSRLKSYLAERLGMDIDLYKTSGGYGLVIEAMRAKKIDVATLGPFGYLIASEKAGAEAIVVSGSRATGQGAYRGTISVAKDSPIQTIEQLVANSKGLTFSFVDPASTSGFLVQRAYFQSLGIDPDTAFRKTMFSMNHVASAMTLMAGKVDAAAVMQSTIAGLEQKGKIHEGDIRVLWTSPDLPTSPIVIRKELPDAFKREVQQAFVDMPDRDPELWAMWPRSGTQPDAALLPGNDAMFDGLRAMARNIKNLSLLEP